MSKILRAKHAQAKLGIKKSKFYDDIKTGLLPKPVSLGGRATGFVEAEIDAHIELLRANRDRRYGKRPVPSTLPDPPDDDDSEPPLR